MTRKQYLSHLSGNELNELLYFYDKVQSLIEKDFLHVADHILPLVKIHIPAEIKKIHIEVEARDTQY